MPAERFYVDAPLHGTLSLEGPEFHHLAHVMRVRIGEEVELVDGRGGLAQGKVVGISKHGASIAVESAISSPVSPPDRILAIPLMRPAKLELVVEKGTELGAGAFWLYAADHSEKEELSPNQLERLHHIAIAAMKQCGRLDLPAIACYDRLEEIFGAPGTYLFGDTRAKNRLAHREGKIVFITGPEKGFSERELKLLDQKATGVCLHRNILRAETAPIAAICQLL